MLQRFIWIFIGIVIVCSPVHLYDEIIGELEIWLEYENELGLQPGWNCDPFRYLCDLYFKVCLTQEGSSELCNLGKETTPIKFGAQVYDYKIISKYTTNKKMNLAVEVFDADIGSPDDKVGIFVHSFLPTSAYPKLEVKAMELLYGHESTKMRLEIRGRCKPDHYGSQCKYCRSTKGGHCDSNGTLVCFQGYYGPDCSNLDGCRNLTCASFSECVSVGENFACSCDNTLGKRCEEGYDPCAEHICWNGGTCVPTGEHFNFAKCVNCSERWGGLHCDELLDGCTYEEFRLGHPPCLNGGHCIVDSKNKTQFSCLCASGWQGPYCETSLVKALVNTILIWISFLILVICCITLLYFGIRFCIIQTLRRRREQGHFLELMQMKNKIGIMKDVCESNYNSSEATIIVWRRRPCTEDSGKNRDSDLYDSYEIVDGDGPFPSTELESSVSAMEDGCEPLTRIPRISTSECAFVNTSDSTSTVIKNRPLPSTPKEDEDNPVSYLRVDYLN